VQGSIASLCASVRHFEPYKAQNGARERLEFLATISSKQETKNAAHVVVATLIVPPRAPPLRSVAVRVTLGAVMRSGSEHENSSLFQFCESTTLHTRCQTSKFMLSQTIHATITFRATALTAPLRSAVPSAKPRSATASLPPPVVRATRALLVFVPP